MMSGLLWLLVVFERQESESESLAGLTEINTSLLPTGGFSWDDSSSSAGTHTDKRLVSFLSFEPSLSSAFKPVRDKFTTARHLKACLNSRREAIRERKTGK